MLFSFTNIIYFNYHNMTILQSHILFLTLIIFQLRTQRKIRKIKYVKSFIRCSQQNKFTKLTLPNNINLNVFQMKQNRNEYIINIYVPSREV